MNTVTMMAVIAIQSLGDILESVQDRDQVVEEGLNGYRYSDDNCQVSFELSLVHRFFPFFGTLVLSFHIHTQL